MNWNQMCEVEPELKVLEDDILAFKATRKRLGVYVSDAWYEKFKPRMTELVGRMAKEKELSSSEVYSEAYKHLWLLLSKRTE